MDSVLDYTINILKQKSLSGSSYIKLPQKLDHPKKGLFNIQLLMMMMMMMNALHVAWSDIYILQIIIQQKFKKLTRTL